jgi:hypothetical protein
MRALVPAARRRSQSLKPKKKKKRLNFGVCRVPLLSQDLRGRVPTHRFIYTLHYIMIDTILKERRYNTA